MAISAEGKIGFGLGFIGLGGAGAIMVFPTYTEIGWALLVASGIGLIGLAFHHFARTIRTYWPIFLGILVSVCCLAAAFVLYRSALAHVASAKPLPCNAVLSSNTDLSDADIACWDRVFTEKSGAIDVRLSQKQVVAFMAALQTFPMHFKYKAVQMDFDPNCRGCEPLYNQLRALLLAAGWKVDSDDPIPKGSNFLRLLRHWGESGIVIKCPRSGMDSPNGGDILDALSAANVSWSIMGSSGECSIYIAADDD